jgi:hypothetical protein
MRWEKEESMCFVFKETEFCFQNEEIHCIILKKEGNQICFVLFLGKNQKRRTAHEKKNHQ